MQDSTFTPAGPTVLVGTVLVQVDPPGNNTVQRTSYRVRCLATGYLSWTPMIAANATSTAITASTAPANLVPSANTIGMAGGTVETFTLPQNAWFISSVAAGFEVTPGEGL